LRLQPAIIADYRDQSEMFSSYKTIPCVVVNVPDGDTIRCRHVPGFELGSKRQSELIDRWRGDLKSQTILVRLYAVDAPETAKAGNVGQPMAQEATDFVKSKLLGEVVLLKLLGKDQYGRVLSVVIYDKGRRFLGLLPGRKQGDISVDLVDRGLATVYTGKGGVYDNKRPAFDKLQERAELKKRGIWSLTNMETPQDYKARRRQNSISKQR